MSADRKASFKTRPNARSSQEERRKSALEEQKRRRAQKFDESRQIDLFAELNLGHSDDEADPVVSPTFPIQAEPVVPREGIAKFASMLDRLEPSSVPSHTGLPQAFENSHSSRKEASKKKKKKRKGKPNDGTKEVRPNSKWADKCMYAELLEMLDDRDSWNVPTMNGKMNDGLPNDLESSWVAVAPVPVGKRCLAVTHQSSGLMGTVPNTTLRSRVLGKSLIPPFPSSLPPLTVLDCILDPDWQHSGILHVLDVVKWKGQDIADCETAFRFWWRDTRVAELPQYPPPSNPSAFSAQPNVSSVSSAIESVQTDLSSSAPPVLTSASISKSTTQIKPPVPIDHHSHTESTNHIGCSSTQGFRFPYPTTFLPIPYHTDTSLEELSEHVVPRAREVRKVFINLPTVYVDAREDVCQAGMQVDSELSSEGLDLRRPLPAVRLDKVAVNVVPDGLLLYVSSASYEPGTSPLSVWVPISLGVVGVKEGEGPLDVFERLVRRRLQIKGARQGDGKDMEVG